MENLQDRLICAICGKSFKHLGTHVVSKHKMLANEYKKMMGLDMSHPLVTADISQKQRANAYKYKQPERLIRTGVKTRFKKHSVGRPKEKVSAETLERLKHSAKIMNDTLFKDPERKKQWIEKLKARPPRKHSAEECRGISIRAQKRWDSAWGVAERARRAKGSKK